MILPITAGRSPPLLLTNVLDVFVCDNMHYLTKLHSAELIIGLIRWKFCSKCSPVVIHTSSYDMLHRRLQTTYFHVAFTEAFISYLV
jgi:hypothetical protein